jgi:hypothetical protein
MQADIASCFGEKRVHGNAVFGGLDLPVNADK